MVKKIAIRDEIYKKLVSIKRADESFSDLFDRLLDSKDSLVTLKKLRASVDFEKDDKEQMLKEIAEKRVAR